MAWPDGLRAGLFRVPGVVMIGDHIVCVCVIYQVCQGAVHPAFP